MKNRIVLKIVGMARRYRVNQKYKDRIFRMIFHKKKDLLSLYNAVNGTDYTNPDNLEIRTLDDAVYLGYKNDLSFLISDTLNLYLWVEAGAASRAAVSGFLQWFRQYA